MAERRRGLNCGLGSSLAATVMALANLENRAPRFWSVAPFLCLICDHLECPDIQVLKSK